MSESGYLTYDDIRDPVHKELHRGLALAFDKFASFPGMAFDSKQFLETGFVRSNEGLAMRFNFALVGHPSMEEDVTYDYINHKEDQFREMIETRNKKTFRLIKGREPIDDPKASVEDTALYHSIEAANIGDMQAGINDMLRSLGCSANELINFGKGR